MRTLFLLLFAISLTGCANLKSRVFEAIHEGDPVSHVKDVLGEPDTFLVLEGGATGWYYSGGGNICGIAHANEKVSSISCWNDPNYVSIGKRIGAGMQAFGQGLRQSSQNRSVSCTSTNYGYSTHTDCQ